MIHCGFVGILGLPNAGKSTLLNKILDEKIAIVSSKPQTTRQSSTGVLTKDNYQMIFFDSPGFVEPKEGIFKFLASEFDRVIDKSDHLIMMISHEQKDSEVFNKSLEKVKKSKKPVSYLYSKSDIEESEFVKALKLDMRLAKVSHFEYSVKTKDMPLLFDWLKSIAETFPQETQALYDSEMISLDRTRDIVSEFIREECFLNLDKEIPFGLGVIIQSFKTVKGMTHIEANIIVDKENHKGIVIGKSGAMLKKIGQNSRSKIEKLLGEKIYLGLHVSYKQNWMKNKAIMNELGYKDDKR
jgi:GTPase